MANQEKISLYNLADLKNTSDDAIPNYLNSLKFKQSHFMVDVRLGLGYASFLIAAACFAWDYKLGWDDTKHWTAVAVAFYAVLSGCLTLWTSKVEAGTVYQGVAPSGEEISINTSTGKLDPTYKLTVVVSKIGAEPKVIELAAPLNKWFDESGYFVAPPFQEFLASSVPLIGARDPKRVKSSSQAMLDANPELLDAMLGPQGEASGAEVGEKKASRRKA